MSFELPIFPLNVVLFPGMALPLHIFEPRYRVMIERCLESDRTFGVALLAQGVEGQSGTLPALVGCIAQITDVAPFADGRINLQTVGGRRFQVLALREEDDYLIGTLDWLDDEAETAKTPELARRAQWILKRYLDSLVQNTALDAELGEIEMPADAYLLSMWIGAVLTLPNAQKQTLLELTSTDTRLELEDFLLRRAEIVQRAYARRLEEGGEAPPYDTSLGPMAQFASLN